MTVYYGYIEFIFRYGVATIKFRAFTFSVLFSEVVGITGGPRRHVKSANAQRRSVENLELKL